MITGMKNSLMEYLNLGNDYVNYVQIGFLWYYSVIIALAGAMLIGTIIFAAWNVRWWKWLTHIGWCFLALLQIIGSCFTFILVIVVILLSDIWGLFDIATLLPYVSGFVGSAGGINVTALI